MCECMKKKKKQVMIANGKIKTVEDILEDIKKKTIDSKKRDFSEG